MEAPSRHKSRLLREMSRDLNHSIASSTGSNHGTVSTDSTMTDFNPDKDDVIMSTRQLDTDLSHTNPKLPKLRDTAKKYGRWAPRQPEYVINTSALDKAFPDFTQGSVDDALDTESIEVGRGGKSRPRGASRNIRFDYSDNFDSPITVGDYKVLRSPHRAQDDMTDSVLRDTKRNNAQKLSSSQQRRSISQKENVPPSGQRSATGSPYISGASLAAGGQRRSLAELHAYVADESNGSLTLDSRPAHKNFQAKNTRFSSQSKAPQPTTFSKKHQLEDVLAESIRTASGTPSKGQLRKTQAIDAQSSDTPNPTQQSFILPATTEVSHVVSAETGAGIPVVVRAGRVQPRNINGFLSKFDDVYGIEVPTEEEDIYLSVELLKSRVAQLENEKAESQRIINELKEDNLRLQAEVKEMERRRRSDSALGMVDGGSDSFSDREKNTNEKTKLQAHAASLQSLLNESRQKLSSQELRLKTNTAERDHAVKQLTQAQRLIEQLKAENDDLREENESLQLHLKEFVIEADEDTQSWKLGDQALKQEVASLKKKLAKLAGEVEGNAQTWAKKETALKRKIRRQFEVLQEVQEVTQEIRNNTRELDQVGNFRRSSRSTRSTKRKSTTETASPGGKPLATNSDEIDLAQTQDLPPVDRSINTEQSYNDESSPGTTVQRSIAEANNPEGSTADGSEYASIVGANFMANLRQLLRESRIMKGEAHATATATYPRDDTAHTARSVASSRAPSTKRPTGILKNGGTQNRDEFDVANHLSVRGVKSHGRAEDDHTNKSSASRTRRYSDSAAHESLRRRRRQLDDMTSEFIIPDILSDDHGHATQYPALSISARRILDGLCKHDAQNCTVCARVVSFDNKSELKSKVHVPQPVPVSDRMPIPAPYEDEPTMRPVVKPGLALATVIKGLKDEVAHLKVEYSRIQAMYNKHDSSLGMRQRKALKKNLDELLKAIDGKSDQIYSLYDVLEGQKQSGQQMTEQDVETTLLSVGLDPNEFTETSKASAGKGAQKQSDNVEGLGDEDDDSELDLPWEGIEDTNTGSVGGTRRQAFA